MFSLLRLLHQAALVHASCGGAGRYGGGSSEGPKRGVVAGMVKSQYSSGELWPEGKQKLKIYAGHSGGSFRLSFAWTYSRDDLRVPFRCVYSGRSTTVDLVRIPEDHCGGYNPFRPIAGGSTLGLLLVICRTLLW